MYLYSDVRVDSRVCMCAECTVSGSKTVSCAASLPYMKSRMYSYYNFAQTVLHGNNHSFTAVYTIIITTGNVVLYTARAAYVSNRLTPLHMLTYTPACNAMM